MSDRAAAFADLAAQIARCRACPRLVAWREEVARTRRASYADQEYWGRPVPGFGDPAAELLVLGLAPAAHGANRTGRVFTGDRSGDFLFAALHRVGLANQADERLARRRADAAADLGERLGALRAARQPAHPGRAGHLRAVAGPGAGAAGPDAAHACVVLGAFGWGAGLPALARAGWRVPSPRPAFGHGAEAVLEPAVARPADPLRVLGSYHVSQQNTFTGRLTPGMLDDVLTRAIAGITPPRWVRCRSRGRENAQVRTAFLLRWPAARGVR